MVMNPEQQKLQEDLQIKQLELDALKSKVSLNENLTVGEENKQKELEAFIAENTSKLQLQNTQIEVTNAVEISNRRAYEELIKWSAIESQMKLLNKTDAQIEQFALRIDQVVRKYYDKELAGFPASIINGMCAGTQPAMIEALANSWNSSSEFFAETANGLSDNWIGAIFNKITSLIGNVKNIASGLLGPLTGEGPFPDLAKRVQNLTAFVVLHKNDFSDWAVPQLVNPYKYKELLDNPVRNTTKDFDKPETLALFTLHTTEWNQLLDDEKKKLKDIVNNPQLKINEQTITNMEKALNTADKFLDKRSFRQDAFMGIFDKIRGPLSLFFGKGKNVLPSSILWTGLLATALGVSSLDARYLSKNIIPAATTSPTPTTEQSPNTLTDEQLKSNIASELLKYKSPVSADMVMSTFKKFKVPTEYIMAFMKNDSHYGTDGDRAIDNHNPGNVWNTNDWKNKYFATWADGVDAVWSNLKARIDAYHLKVNKDKYPTVAELAKWVSDNWTRFFGVYMTASEWPQAVTTINNQLANMWISNKDQLLAAA